MFCVALLASLFLLIVQIEVFICDIKTSSVCVEDVCIVTGQRMNCTGRNRSLECLNHMKLEKLDILSVYLENNAIHRISSAMFQDMGNLQQLYLQNNNIGIIEDSTFVNVKKLEYLHLEHNSIKRIETHAFKNLSNLMFIDLEDNQLTTVTSGTFANCWNLWQVCLTKNNIEEIQQGSFRENSTLIHFYCSQNKLAKLEFLKNLPTLVYLDLSHNIIEDIPAQTLFHMKNLMKMDVSYNKLEVLNSGVFGELQALVTLNLSNNRLKHLGEGAFDRVSNLKYLYLKNNALKEFSYRVGFEKRNHSYLSVYIDENYWRCNFIHNLLQLKIKLIHEKRKNVSNVEGIPCTDEMKYSKQMETVTSVTEQFRRSSKVASSTTTNVTIASNVIKVQAVTTTTAISSNATTSTIITKTSTARKQKSSTTGTAVARSLLTKKSSSTGNLNTMTEENVSYVTVPEIKINLSLLITSILGIILLITAIIIFSIRFSGRNSQYCSNSHSSDHDLTKDGYMRPRPTPPQNSNFYVTLDPQNQYEEVDLVEPEHVYETVE